MAEEQKAPLEGLDPEVADRWLALQEQLQEAKKRRDQGRPLARPQDLMVRDPETGERRVFEAVTEEQGLKIRFRPMTLGDHADVPPECWKQPFGEWPLEVAARLLDRNLVEPDLRAEAGGEITPEWLARHLEKLAVDDLVMAIVTHSQPRLRVPKPAEGDEEEGKARPTGGRTSRSRSPSAGSTSSGTASSESRTSTASR